MARYWAGKMVLMMALLVVVMMAASMVGKRENTVGSSMAWLLVVRKVWRKVASMVAQRASSLVACLAEQWVGSRVEMTDWVSVAWMERWMVVDLAAV